MTAHPANRCGECHNIPFNNWSGSGHARAARSPLYVAMRSRSDAAACDACHTPLALKVDPLDPVAGESVTCEVCHAIADVSEHASRTSITYSIEDNIKRGPLCGGKDNYFHKMGCSPLHRESLLCAGCHKWSMPLSAGGELPIFTAYDEWKASTYEATSIPCQDCHMPKTVDEVAAGWGEKKTIAHHGFMGEADDLRRRALSMAVRVEDRAGKLHAAIELSNVAAGHMVPTGLPGRQIVLSLRVLDRAGRVVEHASRAFGRVLVDEGGAEVPFYAARREASDNRIAPGEKRLESFSFDVKGEGEIQVELLWRRVSPAVAAVLKLPVEEQKLVEARVPFGALRGSARAHLPRTVAVKP
ncbi:MAG TPA: multiheme c-type cytochrome [Polyangiaceae bacterium]|nr:multiheme c-type cytochrome [Polyangiaceae bacterium]